MSIATVERYRGCLLGLALGDAVGAAVEFSPPGSFEPLTDLVGGGKFRLEPGQWTDDTSMALCLAESLLESGYDVRDQMQRYRRWMYEGHLSCKPKAFGIGHTVSSALMKYNRTGEPYSGFTEVEAAGNGSLMRLAPVPLYYASAPQEAIEKSADSSRATHGTVTCLDACRYFAGLLVGVLQGRTKDEVLSAGFDPVPGYFNEHPLCPEIAEVAVGSFKARQPPDIRAMGYVVRTLEAALWAFYSTTDFRGAILAAANLGEDADTTAAVTGQIAGAYYGEGALPVAWLDKLAQRELITSYAQRLYQQGLENFESRGDHPTK